MNKKQSIGDRLKSPTPKLFKKIRNVGLLLTGISAAILTAPVALPALVISAAGYMAVGGSIAAVISQLTSQSE